MTEYLERRALRIVQDPNAPLFLFALSASDVARVADVSRIGRDEAGKLIGYQRPEKRTHVKQIQDYLDSGAVLFPNGLILALPDTVRWKSSRGPAVTDGLVTAGTLEIPLPVSDADPRPAWIVDGQQRSLALSRTSNRDFPVPIAGFVANDLHVQRDQFLRVNTVQPLPANLVIELLPEVASAPSPKLSARKLPAALVEMLNQDSASPFRGLIRRASTDADSRGRAVVTDTSLVSALEESLNSPSGSLFPYRNIATGLTDTAGIRDLLLMYWSGVRAVFPRAWGRPATQSRLMHGAGIRSMSRLMDRVMLNIDLNSEGAAAAVETELQKIAPLCKWTEGTWDEIGLKWNEVQNVPKHISTLSNYLVRKYVQSPRTSP